MICLTQLTVALSEESSYKQEKKRKGSRMSSQIPDPSTTNRVRVPHHQEVPFQLPDLSTPDGQSLAHQLQKESFIWLTTVDKEGMPHSIPLAFLWDEAQATFLIYSMPEGDREHVKHIQDNPKVGLHFNFVMTSPVLPVFTGEASVSADDPLFDQVPAWVEKYQALFSHMGMPLRQAAEAAPVALRIRPLTMIASTWTEREA